VVPLAPGVVDLPQPDKPINKAAAKITFHLLETIADASMRCDPPKPPPNDAARRAPIAPVFHTV
jgi:hypothetical protein